MQSPWRHITLVTGRLAAPSLREVAGALAQELGFDFDVAILDVSVAALLTPHLVSRRLRPPEGTDLILLPGYCLGDLEPVRSLTGARVERGPKDLRDLPQWFQTGGKSSSGAPPADYGGYRIEILAEINQAPDLSAGELVERAERYRSSGADVIDLGCNPGGVWSGLGAAVRRLKDAGFRVSVDSMEPREILSGIEAGAELVLSISSQNLEVIRDLPGDGFSAVAVPDDPASLAGLDGTIAALSERRIPYRIDPILEPLGFGFSASLGRYLEVRRRRPEAEMLMGIGNLTELTDADSGAINVLLAGFCAEQRIHSVLTTEVIPWARSSVRELDLARRLMDYAIRIGTLPKHLEANLILLRDPALPEFGAPALAELAGAIRDPSFRIFAEGGKIHLMNRDVYFKSEDPFELMEELLAASALDDVSHAFYLGYEMAKARIALQLGKRYEQDRALRWGFLSVEEASHQESKRRRNKPPPPAGGPS